MTTNARLDVARASIPNGGEIEALGDKYGLTFTFDPEVARQKAIHDEGFDPEEKIPEHVIDAYRPYQAWDHDRALLKLLPRTIAEWKDWLEEQLAKPEGGGLFAEQRRPAATTPSTTLPTSRIERTRQVSLER